MLKKKLKGITTVALVISLAASIFTGCRDKDSATSGQGKSETGQKTIEFWTISLRPTFDDFFNGKIKEYEEKNKNVKINWTDLPIDAIQNKLVTATAGGNSPDVVNLNTPMALTLGGKGALVNLNKEATAEQKDVYISTLFESTKLKDSIYAFPWYGAPSVCMYNKDLFAKAGFQNPPKTFEEMLSMAKQMKEKTGAYLYIPEQFSKILFLEGVKLVSDDKTKAAFNTAEAVELMERYKKVVDEGSLPKTDWGAWDAMLQQFSTGKLAMINSGAQTIKRIKDEAPDIYKTMEVTTPIVGKTNLVMNPLMNMVVPAKSKNHKEAIDFAHYITNDENQLAFSKTVQIFPSTKKAAEDPFFRSDTNTIEGKALAIAADELKISTDLSIGHEKEAEIFETINKIPEAVLLGGKDIKAALTEAETKVNSILSSK